MHAKSPGGLIFPAIVLIGLILFSLSGFIGTIFSQNDFHPSAPPAEHTRKLSDLFPASIQQWKMIIEKYAERYQLDPNLIAAVMLQESGGDPQIISSSGAVGLMQVMPRDGIAASFYCGAIACFTNRPTIKDLSEPEFNVDFGSRMLSNLIKKEGSVRQALLRYGPFDTGYGYADTVLSLYKHYQ